MQARFRDWENKALVQVAAQFELEGLRITWPDVTCVMAKSTSTDCDLELRLAILKQTYEKKASCFPRCFFTGPAQPSIFLLSRRPGSTGGRKGSSKGHKDAHGGDSFVVSLSVAVTMLMELMRASTESMLWAKRGMLKLLALAKFRTF
ncbi:hypothetical protein GN958_ATG08386 [Phytophthora infestans]|uniref:Uncharacterized protein n=1 Tax=Phytophthora infestans TaxID=4787 RepID=A0A8S9UNE7_PHYIN|nr:hypothetical protein GN958_ATG08386 [Phytophthora infestans]